MNYRSKLKIAVDKRLRASGWEVRRLDDGTRDVGLYRRLYPPESVERRAFYNIGAGGFLHPCWTNVDYPSEYYREEQRGNVHIAWDAEALVPLPIQDGTAEAVYSSHTIEHLSDAAVANIFAESFRVLKPGGVVRMTTPDMDLEYHAFESGDRDFFYWKDFYTDPDVFESVKLSGSMADASIQQLLIHHVASAASTLHSDAIADPITDEELDRVAREKGMEEVLDYVVDRVNSSDYARHPGDHVNWWTFGKAERKLRDAGFTDVRKSGYGQSLAPPMRNTVLFDTTHPKMSLYVEAYR